jgi:hypothetical protein
MKCGEVIRNSKLIGGLKIVLGGVLACIATKLALGGAAEYGYGLGAESMVKPVSKFAEEAKKRGLTDEDIDACYAATNE